MLVSVGILVGLSALLHSGAGVQTPAPAGSVPVQFVLRNDAMKEHASVVNNELTITAGVNEPYLSSIAVGDFEATGELAMPADSRATLNLYAIVDESARVRRRMEIALPPMTETSWQSMTVTSLNHHIRVLIAGGSVAEREIEGDAYGLFGFEVSRGQLSLREWRVIRRDSSAAPQARSTEIADARQLPPNARMPRLLHEVKPHYTADAMRRRVQGVVDVDAVVEVDGSVRPLSVTKSLDAGLDVEAVNALKQWKFEPALLDGRPVPCRVSIQLTFVLSGR